MRFSKLLLTTAAGFAAFAAVAQQPDSSDEQPPAETKAEPSRGLSDLEETVNQLLEEEGDPISRQSDAPRVPERLPPEPEASRPPPEPALEPESSEPSPAEPPVEASEPEPRPQSAPAPSPPPPESALPPQPRPETPRPAAAVTTAATAPRTPPRLAPPLSRTELAALDRTAERGRLLIAIARAGILATQDMLTRVSDPEGAGITGWIAQPEGNAMAVTFYAGDGESTSKAVYRANVLGGRVVSREIFLGPDRPSLTPLQARMAAARAATEGLDHRACTTQPFNVFVVPPASASAPIDVYQVTAPTQRGHYPLGGNYRTTIAPDGTVAESRGFTNSCLDIEATAPTAGQPARPIGVTHLLDRTPTEIHVFLALWSGRPLLVATGEPQRIWQVTDRIVEVRQ